MPKRVTTNNANFAGVRKIHGPCDFLSIDDSDAFGTCGYLWYNKIGRNTPAQ